jgi:excisionase family DNA binding protein
MSSSHLHSDFFILGEIVQMTQKLLTVKEVSEILDLKPARVYELTRERKIPFVQIGERQYRYSETALTNWIENGGNQNETAENQCSTPFK